MMEQEVAPTGQTVPLEIAAQHFVAAAKRGEEAGMRKEHERIMHMLKKHGHYDAILTIKKHDKKKR